MKVLALDFGSARTGVAVSDPTGTVARPLTTVQHATTDAGFAKLAGLTALSELRLDHTEISDASAKAMTDLRNLKYVDLYHTSISEQGFQSLKKALPGCQINWSLDSSKRERRT